MNAKELIGKKAIRTNYAVHPNETKDNSFTKEPIVIKKATDTHIIYTYVENHFLFNPNTLHILNHDFCDDNWIDYDELISGIDPDPVTINVTVEGCPNSTTVEE